MVSIYHLKRRLAVTEKSVALFLLRFNLIFLFGFLVFHASLGYGDVRQITQWRPYLEWEVYNSSWSGNPYDLDAKVTFTHLATGTQIVTSMFYDENDTWKWRFTGTLAGNWQYQTQSADSQLSGIQGSVYVTAQKGDGFYKRLTGDKWGWSGSNRAVIPNYLMVAEDPSAWDSESEVDHLVEEFISGHGFTGFHVPSMGAFLFDKSSNGNRFSDNPLLNSSDTNPDPSTFAALEKLIIKTHEAGGGVHIWLWGDSQRNQNLTVSVMNNAGGANGVVDRRMLRYLAARLGPIPGWSVGYGFDLFEWTNESMLTSWATFLHSELGWSHFLGARGRKNVIENSQISERMDYTAYEQHAHLFDYDDWVATMVDRSGKPSFSEDRFRIRRNDKGKDLKQDGSDTRTLLWELAMAGGIAAIWGNLYDNPAHGESAPYPNKEQIKTYDTFWHARGYFEADLAVQQNQSGDVDTRVLVNTSETTWVLYRRDAEAITLDFSSAPQAMEGVAVDTREPYKEISLGTIDNTRQIINLPQKSDWVVRLSSEGVTPPPPHTPAGKSSIPSILPLLDGE